MDEILDADNFMPSDADWENLNMNFPVQKNMGCTVDVYFELV